jgi:hypothetical protein
LVAPQALSLCGGRGPGESRLVPPPVEISLSDP